MAAVRSALYVVFCVSCSGATAPVDLPIRSHPRAFRQVESLPLRASSGTISSTADGWLHVAGAGMRAETAGAGPEDAAELHFSYRGPSRATARLADGTLRRQIGLKLRARDTCNLVYVMWHIAPTAGIHVSLKLNPSAHDHQTCGASGYLNVLPTKSSPIHEIAARTFRVLRAAIYGDRLVVTVDGTPVWEGVLPQEARSLRGPTGVRSDNGEFDFIMR